jgi:hypothetical protein
VPTCYCSAIEQLNYTRLGSSQNISLLDEGGAI